MPLARIYAVFPLACSRCGARMRIADYIFDPPALRDILVHLGAPPRRRASRPPAPRRRRTCPLPPPQNWLKGDVSAGEKYTGC